MARRRLKQTDDLLAILPVRRSAQNRRDHLEPTVHLDCFQRGLPLKREVGA